VDRACAVAAFSSAVDVPSDTSVFNVSGTPADFGVPAVAGVSGPAVVGSLLLSPSLLLLAYLLLLVILQWMSSCSYFSIKKIKQF
jgi:hypothetical protein